MSNSKRKILFLIENLDEGKAAKSLSILVQYIDKTKFDVTVCSINAGGQYEAVIRENVKYKAILTGVEGMKHKFVYRSLPLSLVYKMYVPHGNDVEIAYSEGFATKLLAHASKGKTKRYAWVHTDFNKNHWSKEAFSSDKEESEVYNRYDKVIGVTNLVCEAFQRQLPSVKVPVERIYSPVDSLSVRLKSMNSSKEEPFKVSTRIVAWGRLEPNYEYGRLLRVVNRLVGEGYDLGLWIFGEGTDRILLERYIQTNELQQRVKLFGFHPNPYRFMIQGQLFFCGAYCSSVISALILGMPVVAIDTPELKELLKDGECGLMVSNSDEALYQGITKLLDDPELLGQYRQRGEVRGFDFDIEALIAPVEGLLMN